MEKKYNLDKVFVGNVHTVVDEYTDSYEPKTFYNQIFAVNDQDKYVDLISLNTLCNSIFLRLKSGDKLVYEQEKVLFSDYLKNKGIIVNNEESLTRDEILKLYEMSKPQEVENTLAIIKPDGMFYIDKIIEMFYQNDLKIKDFKVEQLSKEKVEEHYAHLLDKPFYPKLRDYMMATPVALMILEGNNAVEKLRTLMGPTNSALASPNTIRGKFGTDITYNAIHGSDSKENAEIEINRFFEQKQKVS